MLNYIASYSVHSNAHAVGKPCRIPENVRQTFAGI